LIGHAPRAFPRDASRSSCAASANSESKPPLLLFLLPFLPPAAFLAPAALGAAAFLADAGFLATAVGAMVSWLGVGVG